MKNKYHLLFPGRHHLLTNTQEEYISDIIKSNLADILDFNQSPLEISGNIQSLIWAVTSSNHSGTKRNPLPHNRREAMITDFSNNLAVDSLIFHIDDVGVIDNYPEYICKKIALETDMQLFLTPENTIVISSTPEIAQGYMKLGFKVIPLERNNQTHNRNSPTPWQLLNHIASLSLKGKPLQTDKLLSTTLHSSTKKIFDKYNYRDKIKTIQQDKILFPDGDLTETRDYNTYGRSFDEGGTRKYDLIKEDIKPGVIVDIGCCTGSLLQHISRDTKHHESDLYGIDIVPKFIKMCETNKLTGKFGNENVFFMQQNVIEKKVFPNNFVDCFISTALTHEIVSYDGFEKLDQFAHHIHTQLKKGGQRINVDVVGPNNPNEVVVAILNTTDGVSYDHEYTQNILSKITVDYKQNKEEFTGYVSSLSTWSRFLLFTETFRQKQGDKKIHYTLQRPGKIEIRMQDITEFISKKDYTDNWISEMNEKFCFWSIKERETYLSNQGFSVVSTPIHNDWIYKNRYEGSVDLYTLDEEKISYPATNVKQVITKK